MRKPMVLMLVLILALLLVPGMYSFVAAVASHVPSENSTYNRVHHCTFYSWVYGAYDEHRGGLLDIGSWAEAPVDESYYNLIEDNVFAYGGHHTLGVYSRYNVIRHNYIHNETNPTNWDFEGYRGAITDRSGKD